MTADSTGGAATGGGVKVCRKSTSCPPPSQETRATPRRSLAVPLAGMLKRAVPGPLEEALESSVANVAVPELMLHGHPTAVVTVIANGPPVARSAALTGLTE